jgi:4-hydroxybenzoyl-CoA reductase subunit beta
MLLPDHEFLKPQTLAEGLALLAGQPRAQPLAGGTDVIYNMRGRLFTPPAVVAIRHLPELAGVRELADGSLDIGAGCRLTDLVADPLVARYPALVTALRAVASRHVRNMATLGGNLCLDTRCWFTNQTEEWRDARGPCLKTGVDACHAIHGAPVCVALNNADTPPALIALDATVTLVSQRGERRVRLRDFYRNDGITHTVRQADELLARVLIPPTTDRMVFSKDTARQGMDFAYGTIAARADGQGGTASRVTLVLGSLTTAPLVLDDIAAGLVAAGLGDAAIETACAGLRPALGPLTNLYSPAAYKRELARSLLRKAIVTLREM